MKFKTNTKKDQDFERIHIPGDKMYNAELVEVKDISPGQYGDRVAFIYKILEHDVQLAFVVYKTPATVDNKIGQAVIAHGCEINDKEVDSDKFTKKEVKVFVEDYTYEEEGETKTASTISKVKSMVETEKMS